MSKATIEDSAQVRGRTPKDYRLWILWEVGLPLAAPLAVFFVLFSYWGLTHSPNFGARALISVAGSGDLYIFAAFLLVNVAAKIRAAKAKDQEHRDYFEDGEVDPDIPFWVAIVFTLLYFGSRVGFEIMSPVEIDTYKFVYGAASAIFVAFAFLWIDILVCKMHLDDMTRRESIGLISNYYNLN